MILKVHFNRKSAKIFLLTFALVLLFGLALSQMAPSPGHIGEQVNVMDPTTDPPQENNLQSTLENIFARIGSGGGESLWSQGTGDNIYRLNGNVGIGTETPQKELHVDGGARFENLTDCKTIFTNAYGDLRCGHRQRAIGTNYFVKDWGPPDYFPEGNEQVGWGDDVWLDVTRGQIWVPAAGTILVQTSGDISTYYLDSAPLMRIGISEVSDGTPPSGAYSEARVDYIDDPSIRIPYSVARLYNVRSEGTYDFYIVATIDTYEPSNPRLIVKGSFQLIYFPD